MRDRLFVAGVIGAVALLVAVAVLALSIGRYNPSPPSLERDPDPAIPGRVVFMDRDGCIVIAEASGASREDVYCSALHVFSVTWVDEHTIAFMESTADPAGRGTLLDLRTRETLPGTAPGYVMPSPVSVNGEAVSVDSDGNLLVSKDGRVTTIASFDIPRNASPFPFTWSPDGEWILIEYYPPRADGGELWIVSRTGAIKGTLAKGVRGGGASWWIDGHGYTPPIAPTATPPKPSPR